MSFNNPKILIEYSIDCRDLIFAFFNFKDSEIDETLI